ncbi:MAG: GYDIA family GHMP kinase [Flavobacteriaceae bacterium]|tara:strand:+ start:776 stop:1672 length:897 start_codon:yes stop_codon:yes gene_type:complete
MQTFYSHGKLLITSEYLILKGAKGLAVPCNKGQFLKFKTTNSKNLNWKSYDFNNRIWFEAIFECKNFNYIKSNKKSISKSLSFILKETRKLNPKFLLTTGGEIKTQLEFDLNWGLGSSSTLISNLAQLNKINPYKLLLNTYGGSGYDIACSLVKRPIIYEIKNNNYDEINFNPPFKDKLFFIYLNKKQNSKVEVDRFENIEVDEKTIKSINSITEVISKTKEYDEFNFLIRTHEQIISNVINKTSVKKLKFKDFKGEIKSLGAWGGDFILASGDDSPSYFKSKGYKTIIKFDDMVYRR